MSALPGLDLGKVMDHGVEEPAPEARAEEVIEDGVDNTVEHGEAVNDVVEEVEQVGQVAVEGDVGAVECEQQQGQVVGQPADGKRHHHQHHGLHELGQETLRSLRSPDAPRPTSLPEGEGGAPLMPA